MLMLVRVSGLAFCKASVKKRLTKFSISAHLAAGLIPANASARCAGFQRKFWFHACFVDQKFWLHACFVDQSLAKSTPTDSLFRKFSPKTKLKVVFGQLLRRNCFKGSDMWKSFVSQDGFSLWNQKSFAVYLHHWEISERNMSASFCITIIIKLWKTKTSKIVVHITLSLRGFCPIIDPKRAMLHLGVAGLR